jgi:ubiquinol-cytochrome c reductase core subunit 2
MPSGVVVATLENYSPISRVSFCYNAGAKYETGKTRGVTHVLRNAAGNLGTKAESAFSLVKNIQQRGATLSCTTNREHILYTLEGLRSELDDCMYYLGEIATQPIFKPWEVEALVPRHKLDLAQLEQAPNVMVLEALHKAAYRNGGLGNSIYMPKDLVGKHSPELLQDFARQYLIPHNLAVVGVGVDHEKALHIMKKLEFSNNNPSQKPVPSTFHRGEVRIETPNSQVHAAMVTEGVGLESNEILAVGVLQRLLGTGPLVKHSSNTTSSRITSAVAQIARFPFAASCLNISYSETGMFGFQVVAHAAEVGPILKTLVKTFSDTTKGNISDAELQAAKAQLKAAILMEYEHDDTLLEDMDVQALRSGRVTEAGDFISNLDSITSEHIEVVAKKILGNKPAMAVIGDLTCTPYLDELL